jgi:hypothetical protein
LEEYSKRNSGCSSITTPHAVPLDIAICCLGLDKLSLPSLFQTFEFGFNSIHVYDLFVLRDHLEDSCSSVPASVVHHLLDVGAWDSDILLQFEPYLTAQLNASKSRAESAESLSSLDNHNIFKGILEKKEQLHLSCLPRNPDFQRVEDILRTLGSTTDHVT